MKDLSRKGIFWILLASTITTLASLFIIQVIPWDYIMQTPFFWLFLSTLLWVFNELWNWAKVGKRGEMADIAALMLLFFFFLLLTEDLFTALLGAFGVYLFIGIFELRDYAVVNKLGLITAIVYNFIFVMGLLDKFQPIGGFSFRDSAFGFSFWLILILGFAFFGRKYLIVWRFMSPQYLTLGLYLIAWLGVVYAAKIASIDVNSIIYEVLIAANFVVYVLSGPLMGWIMGIKRETDSDLQDLVSEIAAEMGVKGKIWIGVGKYPIINAMAYGAFFDKHIGIICEDWRSIPRNELQGIIAHELAHLRGNHTLILTIITTIDLVIRKLLAIPATTYDYTFNPGLSDRFPMPFFILLNIVIFAFLYIFVRILEGNADRAVRTVGRGKDLAKALFNLEGFYAGGREIGLNTMLLCDEKILPENKQMDYFITAQYISSYLVKPSRLELLSSLLNSHPPSAIRIASMYDESFNSLSEAMMTFTLLSSKKRTAFTRRIEKARGIFENQATEQFLRMFHETSIEDYCTRINRKEDFGLILGKTHLLIHRIEHTHILGTIIDVKWQENAGNPMRLIVLCSDNTQIEVPATLYDATPVQIGGHYALRNFGTVILEKITLADDEKDAMLYFRRNDGSIIKFQNKSKKLPMPLEYLNTLEGHKIFLRKRGTLLPFTCQKIEQGSGYSEYRFHVTPLGQDKEEVWKASELVIFPHHINLAIHKDKSLWKDQIEFLHAIQEISPKITLNLKKPVNNEEIGKITGILTRSGMYADMLQITNIYGKKMEIPLQDIDFISFSGETATVESIKDISFANRILLKLTARNHPNRVFI